MTIYTVQTTRGDITVTVPADADKGQERAHAIHEAAGVLFHSENTSDDVQIIGAYPANM